MKQGPYSLDDSMNSYMQPFVLVATGMDLNIDLNWGGMVVKDNIEIVGSWGKS